MLTRFLQVNLCLVNAAWIQRSEFRTRRAAAMKYKSAPKAALYYMIDSDLSMFAMFLVPLNLLRL